MREIANPLLPAAYDVAWTVAVVLIAALAAVAAVSLARAAKRLTATQALVWTLLILFVPIAGPLLWLTVGRRAGARSTPRGV